MPTPESVTASSMPRASRVACTRTSPPRGRELHAIGQKIDQHLLDGALVGEDRAGARPDIEFQRDASALGLQLDEAHGAAGDVVQVEHFLEQFELAGLDLGHVEDAVDQFEQVPAAFMDQLGVFEIFRAADGAEHLMRHHFGEADDGVERRAQLVTHVGKEARLGTACGLGEIARLDQRAFLRLALGNVARDRNDVGRLVVHGRGGAAADLGPDIEPSRRRMRTSAAAARAK